MSVRFSTKFSSALFRAWSGCHQSPVTRLAAAPPPEPSRHLLVHVGGLMSESTVYSLQCSVSRSTNFIYPSWSPHLTSHQDNCSVVRFSKQPCCRSGVGDCYRLQGPDQRQSWSSVSGAATGQISRGHTWPLPAEAGLSTSILNLKLLGILHRSPLEYLLIFVVVLHVTSWSGPSRAKSQVRRVVRPSPAADGSG